MDNQTKQKTLPSVKSKQNKAANSGFDFQIKRIPSPYTYYSKFNKHATDYLTYYPFKSKELTTWKQQYKTYSPFMNKEIFSDKLRQRRRNNQIQDQEEDDQPAAPVSREKLLFQKTEQLLKVIESHNAESPQMQKVLDKQQIIQKIKKNEEMIDFIDNDQRRQFSLSKQQMQEIMKYKNDIINQQSGEYTAISKEIMDRKNISLKKVLSSIPIGKLEKIIQQKQETIMEAFEKLRPITESIQLAKYITPHISHEQISYLHASSKNKKLLQQKNLTSSHYYTKSMKKPTNKSYNTVGVGLDNISEINNTLSKDNQRNEKKMNTMNSTVSMTSQNMKDNIFFSARNPKKSQEKIQSIKMVNSAINHKQFQQKEQQQQQQKNQSPDAESVQLSKDTAREKLRIKQQEEIMQAINERKKKNKIYLLQQNQNISKEIQENTKMIQSKPKELLQQVIEDQDGKRIEKEQQLLKICSQISQKKSLFDYNAYFYKTYVQHIKGVQTNLSQKTKKASEDFQGKVEYLIDNIEENM